MRANEFINEDTVAGNVAPVVMPLGSIQRRAPFDSFLHKYGKKKRKANAHRRFKNTISN